MSHQVGNSGCRCPPCLVDPTPPQYPFINVYAVGSRLFVSLRESTTSWLLRRVTPIITRREGEIFRVEDSEGKVIEGALTEEHETVYVRKVHTPPTENRCTLV